MARVRLDDRAGLEALYPPDAFRRDALRNAVPNAAVLHGLRILSELDERGAVEVAEATQHTCERGSPDPLFVPAFLLGGDSPAEAPSAGNLVASDDPAYRAFVDRVLEAARRGLPASSGGRDERLAGFHGG